MTSAVLREADDRVAPAGAQIDLRARIPHAGGAEPLR
jgi:hypothetical protein